MKRNKITLLLAAFLLVCGCSDFEEINVNPNNPPTVPANLLLPTVISTAVSSMTGSGNGAAGRLSNTLTISEEVTKVSGVSI